MLTFSSKSFTDADLSKIYKSDSSMDARAERLVDPISSRKADKKAAAAFLSALLLPSASLPSRIGLSISILFAGRLSLNRFVSIDEMLFDGFLFDMTTILDRKVGKSI